MWTVPYPFKSWLGTTQWISFEPGSQADTNNWRHFQYMSSVSQILSLTYLILRLIFKNSFRILLVGKVRYLSRMAELTLINLPITRRPVLGSLHWSIKHSVSIPQWVAFNSITIARNLMCNLSERITYRPRPSRHKSGNPLQSKQTIRSSWQSRSWTRRSWQPQNSPKFHCRQG